ncbi:hypothetical protein [Paenibacillus apiarius]|uniref:hypothetical protein n=1 Tax=Paenibacillus apiarius TaxID=46240 RepID=UPI003B3A1981
MRMFAVVEGVVPSVGIVGGTVSFSSASSCVHATRKILTYKRIRLIFFIDSSLFTIRNITNQYAGDGKDLSVIL